MKWILIGLLGVGILCFLAWLMNTKQQSFDASLLGLLTLGMALILIAIIQPSSIKYGEIEMVLHKAESATKKAEKASKLVNETVAMLLWNHGRWDVGADTEAATKLIIETHGKEKGMKLIDYFVDKNIFKTSEEEKKKYLETKGSIEFPKDTNSPLIEMMNK